LREFENPLHELGFIHSLSPLLTSIRSCFNHQGKPV
jgi:hypothetical protein